MYSRRLVVVALAVSCTHDPVMVAKEAPPVLQLPADVHPLRYKLAVEIVPSRDRFSGTAEIEVQLDRRRDVIWMHGRDLRVTAASVDGAPAQWEQVNQDGLAWLTLSRPAGPGTSKLRFAWDAAYGTQLNGLYRTKEAEQMYALTQFESIAAREAFPCFDDPAFKTPFDVTLTVPADAVAIGNTPIVDETPASAGLRRVRFATTQPLPTYLLLWAVGPFDVVTPPPLPPNAVRDRPLQVRGIAPKGRGGELAEALKVGADIVTELERYFRIPFPYEKLDHVAVPENLGGAMENAGAIVYLENYLLFKEGVTAEETRVSIAQIMAHETAHQWFGDLVTLRWWTDSWLNESFAQWMGLRTIQAVRPQMRASIDALKQVHRVMRLDALASSRAIRQPLTEMARVVDQFDAVTYLKGQGVISMFERWTGPEAFRAGIERYLRSRAHGSGSTDEFLAAIERASGKPVAEAFHSFLEQSGFPVVEARIRCDGGGASLSLKQARYLPIGSRADRDRLWKVPVCARWGAGGAEHEACTLLAAATGELPLGHGCPEWVLPNADAAGYYAWSLSPQDLRALGSRGYPKLSVGERISLAHNIVAAMHAATLPFADGLKALEPIARDSGPEAAEEPIEIFRSAHDDLVPEGLRPKVRTYAAHLYAPAYQRVGWKPIENESAAQRRFRISLLDFLAFTVRDREVLDTATRLGTEYAAPATAGFRPEAVSPDLAKTVLAVAVRESAPALFDLLAERLRTLQDGEVRDRILAALASATDPRLAKRAAALPLDPRLRGHERFDPLYYQSRRPETREVAWDSLQTEFDELSGKLEPWTASYLPIIARPFCDTQHADQAQAFFAGKMAKLPSARQNVDQTVEGIRLCAAYKAAQQASATAFFEGLPELLLPISQVPRRK